MAENAVLFEVYGTGRLRPRIFSLKFSLVFILAILTRPRSAMAAIKALISGKWLRAWNIISTVASEHRWHYQLWIWITEARVRSRWQKSSLRRTSAWEDVLVLLLDTKVDPSAVRRSTASIAAAFGADRVLTVLPATTCSAVDLETALADKAVKWVMLTVAGDQIAHEAGAILQAVADGADAPLLFWDEDVVVAGRRRQPWFKPSWDSLLLRRAPGLVGACIVDREKLLKSTRRVSEGTGPSWLHDVLLDVGHPDAVHVPLVLTHRGSESLRARAPARPNAIPTCDVDDWPSVSIVIPTKDLPVQLEACLAGISMLDYPGATEVLLVDNGTTDLAALRLLTDAENRGLARVLTMPGPFNFSQLNNDAIAQATGEYLCLLNNDIEPLDASWLRTLVQHAMEPNVGAVGPMLLYPDGTVQHAGVVIGLGGAAGHIQKGVLPDTDSHRHWTSMTRRVSAVTAACLVLKRKSFDDVGGFDATAFPVAFNDVDLCLRLQRKGYENRFVAEARLIHHESKSRGEDDNPEKRARFAGELAALQSKWLTSEYLDRWFHPAFSTASERCVLKL